MRFESILHRCLVVFFMGIGFAQAQFITADIKIDASHLDDSQQQVVAGMQRAIQYYIESYNWITEANDQPFTIQAQFYLDTYTNNGYLQIYTGKAFWGNGGDQKYYDKFIQFTYRPGDQLIHTTRFEPLPGFIDYWVNLILAGELDTYDQFSGTQFYGLARKVAELGKQSNLKKGWDERLTDVEELSANQNFRKMKFAFSEAKYFWEQHQDSDADRQINAFLNALEAGLQREQARIYLSQYMNAHYQELGDFLWQVGNRDYVERLARVDDDHAKYYKDMLADW